MTDTVLAHLALRLTSQRENAATEALAFVLNRTPAACAALQRLLRAVIGEFPAIARVSTQAQVGDESRPDLLLQGRDGQPLGYVEAKFWAAFTDAQPVAYLRRLEESDGGVLVVLAPERRLSFLGAEIRERCQVAALAVTERERHALTVGRTRIALVSWSGLLSALEDALVEDRDALSDVRQLRGLCSRFEQDGFVPLTDAEVAGMDVPRRMMAFADLANEIVEAAVGAGIVTVKRLSQSHSWYYAGRYAAFSSAGAWIGLAHRYWAKWGRTPLWVDFGPWGCGKAAAVRTALLSWFAVEPARAYWDDVEESVAVPLLLPIGVEKADVVAAVVEQLRSLDQALEAAGIPQNPEEPPTE